MTLATAGPDGRPSARIVLLKEFDERGLVFYTNYRSRKADELESNPFAALVIHWNRLGLQVRIEGRVEKISPGESDLYFTSRPRGSRIGAWASAQSREITSRDDLNEAVKQFEERFPGNDIPRPPHWGGYRVLPGRIEFWAERNDRLHDRIVYEPEGEGWKSRRLSP
jgi:pyridoxamine 5'-phosphate oxidase